MSQWQCFSDDLSSGHIHMLKLHIFSLWYWRLNIHTLEYSFFLGGTGLYVHEAGILPWCHTHICHLKWRCMAPLYIKDKWFRLHSRTIQRGSLPQKTEMTTNFSSPENIPHDHNWEYQGFLDAASLRQLLIRKVTETHSESCLKNWVPCLNVSHHSLKSFPKPCTSREGEGFIQPLLSRKGNGKWWNFSVKCFEGTYGKPKPCKLLCSLCGHLSICPTFR